MQIPAKPHKANNKPRSASFSLKETKQSLNR